MSDSKSALPSLRSVPIQRALGSIVVTSAAYWACRAVAPALAVGCIDWLFRWSLDRPRKEPEAISKSGRREHPSFVVWFTGLSGSGKSTLADKLSDQLAREGYRVESLDGDKIRDIFPAVGFARADRIAHLKHAGMLASYLERSGAIVIASFISPYEESRQGIRKICRNYIEVHVATSLSECERRDVKGLYARARRGEIRNFTGIDDPYEEPISPELRIDTAEVSQDQALEKIRNHLAPYLDRKTSNGAS